MKRDDRPAGSPGVATAPNSVAAQASRAARRVVAVAFGGLALLLAVLLGERWLFLQAEEASHDRVGAALEVADRITLLDERLTLSANLVLQNNDPRWRERYAVWLPQIYQAVDEATAMASPELVRRFDASTKVSNDRLSAMEQEAFELLDRGLPAQARALLDSPEYAAHKVVLADGTGAFLRDLKAEVQAEADAVTRRAWVLIGLSFSAVLALLALMWRHLNRHLSRVERGFDEQQARQRELQDNIRLKAHVLDGAEIGSWQWSVADDTVVLNERAAALLGLGPDDPAATRAAAVRARRHPQDAERARSAMRRHLRGETSHYECELRIRHRDGRWVWVQERGRVAERDAQGRALLMAGTVFDMSARVAAEQLWQSRAELSSDWYWQTDSEHRMSWVHTGGNEQLDQIARRMLGRRRDEIEFFDAPADGWAALHRRMDAREPFRGLVYGSRAWGEQPRWIELDGRARVDDDGRFIGYEGVGRDVTERRRAADELRASLSLVDALFQALPVPVVMKDLQGRNLRLNRAYSEHHGASAEALMKSQTRDVVDADTAARHAAEQQVIVHTRQPLSGEYRATLRDGRQVDVLINKAPILDAHGDVVAVVCAIFDITAQKATAHALQLAKEAAEAASLTKSAFLATMSHEIRTPMNGVLGMAELLAHSALDAQQTQAVRTIANSAGALLGILDDILDFSKIEAGRLELEAAEFDPWTLVREVCETLLPVAAESGVQLLGWAAPDLPARCIGDATRVRQVLTNLVGNAIKFSGRRRVDGAVGAAPGRSYEGVGAGAGAHAGAELGAGNDAGEGEVAVRIDLHAGHLRLQVCDDGIGMDAQTQARLFEPFMQAERSTTRRFGGTGLGLAITARLVAMMGGQIGVQSDAGAGSIFTVTLPLPGRAPACGPTSPDLSGLRCLLLRTPGVPIAELTQWLDGTQAQVEPVDHPAQAEARAREGGGTVLLVRPAAGVTDVGAGPLRQLLLTRGRRGRHDWAPPRALALEWLQRDTFLGALAALGGRAPAPMPVTAAAPTPVSLRTAAGLPSASQAQAQGRLVLVAEDDVVNRLVVMRQLELLGYAAELAGDGQQALALWRSGRFALLLTDLHMPLVDGYALARTIRGDEAGRGRHAPILALTANAMKGEEQRAFEAGVDAYLTKPIRLADLEAALSRYLPAPDAAPGAPAGLRPPAQPEAPPPGHAPAPPSVPAPVRGPVLAPELLAQLVGDDPDAQRELLRAFRTSAGPQVQALASAVRGGDAATAQRDAHRLKSAARSVGAVALGEWCATVEEAAARPGWRADALLAAGLDEAWPALEHALDTALRRLQPDTLRT